MSSRPRGRDHRGNWSPRPASRRTSGRHEQHSSPDDKNSKESSDYDSDYDTPFQRERDMSSRPRGRDHRGNWSPRPALRRTSGRHEQHSSLDDKNSKESSDYDSDYDTHFQRERDMSSRPKGRGHRGNWSPRPASRRTSERHEQHSSLDNKNSEESSDYDSDYDTPFQRERDMSSRPRGRDHRGNWSPRPASRRTSGRHEQHSSPDDKNSKESSDYDSDYDTPFQRERDMSSRPRDRDHRGNWSPRPASRRTSERHEQHSSLDNKNSEESSDYDYDYDTPFQRGMRSCQEGQQRLFRGRHRERSNKEDFDRGSSMSLTSDGRFEMGSRSHSICSLIRGNRGTNGRRGTNRESMHDIIRHSTTKDLSLLDIACSGTTDGVQLHELEGSNDSHDIEKENTSESKDRSKSTNIVQESTTIKVHCRESIEDAEMDVNDAFKTLLSKFGGRVRNADLLQQPTGFPALFYNIAWLKRHRNRFLVFEQNGSLEYVCVFVRNAKVCFFFNRPNGCNNNNCKFFHVCSGFVTKRCKSFRNKCDLSHNFLEKENAVLVGRLGLDGFSNTDIAQIVRCSVPEVCRKYNRGRPHDENTCPYLHICDQNPCFRGQSCKMEHRCLSSVHNLWVLNSLQLRNHREHIIARMVLGRNRHKKSNGDDYAHIGRSQHQLQSVNSTQHQLKTVNSAQHQLQTVNSTQHQLQSVNTTQHQLQTVNTTQHQLQTVNTTQHQLQTVNTTQPQPQIVNSTQHQLQSVNSTQHQLQTVNTTQPQLQTVNTTQPQPQTVNSTQHQLQTVNTTQPQLQTVNSTQHQLQTVNTTQPQLQTANSTQHQLKTVNTTQHQLQTVNSTKHQLQTVNSTQHRLQTVNTTQHQLQTVNYTQQTTPPVAHRQESAPVTHRPESAPVTDTVRLAACAAHSILDEPKETPKSPCQVIGTSVDNSDNNISTKLMTEAILSIQKPFLSDNRKFRMKINPEKISQTGLEKLLCVKTDTSPICDGQYLCEKYIWETCTDDPCPHYHGYRGVPYQWQIGNIIWQDIPDEANDLAEKSFCNWRSTINVKIDTLQTAVLNLDTMTSILSTEGQEKRMRKVRRLSTRSYCQGQGNLSHLTSWCWYWLDNGDIWKTYDSDKTQYILEKKYLHGQTEYYFEHGRFHYILSFTGMTQLNLETGKERQVLRRPIYVSVRDVQEKKKRSHPDLVQQIPQPIYTVPHHWTPLDLVQPFELVKLHPGAKVFVEVEGSFHSSLEKTRYPISNIFRVQNPSMWDKHCSHKRSMEHTADREGLSSKVDERMLHHGTDSEEVVRGICVNGFDHRVCGKNGTVYGRGAYFAVKSSYSNNYTGGARKRYMFRARVLVGQHTTGTSDLTRPPCRKGHTLYDSCVDNIQNPSIFVLFDQNQSYPEFLIEYEDLQSPVMVPTQPSAPPVPPQGRGNVFTGQPTTPNKPLVPRKNNSKCVVM